VRGKPDNARFAQKLARRSRRQIVLPEMNSAGFQSESDVGAVIDNKTDVFFRGERQRFPRGFVKFTRRGVFVTQLNQARAAFDESSDLFRVRKSADGNVRYRINFRKRERHKFKTVI
jgi:hypothetical protein